MRISRSAVRRKKKRSKLLAGRKRKSCRFCMDNVDRIDYKDASVLRRFMTDRGRIFPRRTSANCARHQRQLATAIKRARYMALLPYIVE